MIGLGLMVWWIVGFSGGGEEGLCVIVFLLAGLIILIVSLFGRGVMATYEREGGDIR